MRLAALLLVFAIASGGTAVAQDEATAEASRIRVVLDSAAGEDLDLADEAAVLASDPSGGHPSVRRPITAGVVELELPPAEAWQICLAAERWWSPCRTVTAGTRTIKLPVCRAARIVGTLRIADDGGDSRALKVAVGPPPGPGPRPRLDDSQLSCELDERARFACSFPATELYAVVRVSGFVSRYFWGLSPGPGDVVDLGVVRLERGASLSGMVDLTVEGVRADRTTARLIPAVGRQAPPEIAAKLDEGAMTSKLSPHGFFQFGGIQPGRYMLEVSHPAFATSSLGPFDVFTGKETELLAPVVLHPPIDIEVFLTPALSPLGQPWTVRVARARDWSAGSDLAFRGEANDAGRLRIEGQSPGQFRFAVTDRLGNRFHSEEVRFEPGDSGFVSIDIPIVEVRGELRLGDDPLAGTVLFGGAQGSLRSRMTADDEGRFAGALAKDGSWEVEIEVPDPPIRTIRRIEVSPDEDGVAEVDIELTDTELFGRVVDAFGLPVPEADVKAQSMSELVHQSAHTDADGEFSFRALPEGPAMVGASVRDGDAIAVSTPTRINLDEELPAGPVELVVRELESLTGQLTSLTGPVPGARVAVTTLGLPVPAGDLTITDLEGRFAVRVPDGAGLLAVIALPPGGFLTTAVVPAESPLDLRAAVAGGDLAVRVETTAEAEAPSLWIEREGVILAPPILDELARGHGMHTGGSEQRFPRLAEGRYRVCALLHQERQEGFRRGESWQSLVQGATRCAEGQLAPGGTLELTIE